MTTHADGRFRVAGRDDHRVYSYSADDGMPDPAPGFALAPNNKIPAESPLTAASVGGRPGKPRGYAYNTDGSHDPRAEFTLDPTNTIPNGIAFDGCQLWVVDSNDGAYAYGTPVSIRGTVFSDGNGILKLGNLMCFIINHDMYIC